MRTNQEVYLALDRISKCANYLIWKSRDSIKRYIITRVSWTLKRTPQLLKTTPAIQMEVELNLYDQVMLDKRENPESFLERLPLRAEILLALEDKSITQTQANTLFSFHHQKTTSKKVTFSKTLNDESKKRKLEPSTCEPAKETKDLLEEKYSQLLQKWNVLEEENSQQSVLIDSLQSKIDHLLEELGAQKVKLSHPTSTQPNSSESPTEKDSLKFPAEPVDTQAPSWIAGISQTEKNKGRTYRKLMQWTSNGPKAIRFEWLDKPLETLGRKKCGECKCRFGVNLDKQIRYEVWVDANGNKIEGTWKEEVVEENVV